MIGDFNINKLLQTLIKNIACLVNVREENKLLRGKELAQLPTIQNAYLIIEDGKIAKYGKMQEILNPKSEIRNLKPEIDANDAYVLPMLVR